MLLRHRANSKLLQLVVFLSMTVVTEMAQPQSSPPLTHRIEVSVQGVPLQGTIEIGPQLQGKTDAAQLLLFENSRKIVQRNSTFFLTVTAIDANGARQDITESMEKFGRLKYMDDGCIAVARGGRVSVTATPDCVSVSGAKLVVAFLSADRLQILGLNEYFFAISD